MRQEPLVLSLNEPFKFGLFEAAPFFGDAGFTKERVDVGGLGLSRSGGLDGYSQSGLGLQFLRPLPKVGERRSLRRKG